MLSALHIEGFQSLADVELELGALTVLVGPSNSGKSAIRRAIEAMATNAPATGRLRTGAEQITVTATTEAGTVQWTKGPKTNAYEVTTEEGTITQAKPGPAITPEAYAVLGLDGQNFSDQFDRPYLVGDSGSAATKTLGELTNITVLFDAQRAAAKGARAASSTAATLADQLQRARQELATYADLATEDATLRAAATALTAAKAAQDEYLRRCIAAAQAIDAHVALTDGDARLAATVDPHMALAHLAVAVDAASTAEVLTRAHGSARTLVDGMAAPLPQARMVDETTLIALASRAHHDTYDAALAARYAAEVAEHTAEAEASAATHAEAVEALAAYDVCPLCGTTDIHLELTP